jgi:DNA-binding NarL/FixJ family response regulator
MRVVIAEDAVLLRAGLVRLLTDAGAEVVAAVGDGDLLVESARRHRPDVCVIDVRMPPTHTDEGIRAALTIRSELPDVGVLVLSQYVEERYAGDLLATGATGGIGYLLKDRVADVGEFVDAVRRVAAGGAALDPEVVAQIMVRSRRRDPIATLTARESDVLGLMAEGRSNSAIAGTLSIGEGSVEKYVNAIFMKLGLEPDAGDNRRVLAVVRYLRS